MKTKDGTPESKCPRCGGNKVAGQTTFTAELGFGVVVVRKVPADICNQCGEDWILPDTARRLEEIVDKARTKRHTVEVLEFAA